MLLELRRYRYLALKWGWLALLGMVFAASGTLLINFLQPISYSASVTVLVATLNVSTINPVNREAGIVAEVQPIIVSDSVLAPVATRYQLSIAQLRQAISVTAPASNGSSVIQPPVTITVANGSAQDAADIANAVAANFANAENAIRTQTAAAKERLVNGAIANLQDELSLLTVQIQDAKTRGAPASQIAGLQTSLANVQAEINVLSGFRDQLNIAYSLQGFVKVLAAATPPARASNRDYLPIITAGLLGVLAAIGLAVAFELLDDHANGAAKVESVIKPVLGLLPAITEGAPLAWDPATPSTQAYQRLRANVGIASQDWLLRTLLITGDDAVATAVVASNLGQAIARAGRRVLLVDANLRQPIVHTLFKIPNDAGLGGMLQDLAQAAHPVTLPIQIIGALPELGVISAGRPDPRATDHLDSPALMRFLAATQQQRVPLLIMTVGNALSAMDAAIIGARVDGVLVVTDATKTRMAALSAVATKLQRAGALTLGAVIVNLPDYSEQDISVMVAATIRAGE